MRPRKISIYKAITVATNIITMLIGLSVSGISLAIIVIPHYMPNEVVKVIPFFEPAVYSILCASTGIVLVSLFGCWSTLWEVAKAINLYAIFLSMLLTIESILVPLLIYIKVQGPSFIEENLQCETPDCDANLHTVMSFVLPAIVVLSSIMCIQTATMIFSCKAFHIIQEKRFQRRINSVRTLTSQATGSHDQVHSSLPSLPEREERVEMGQTRSWMTSSPPDNWTSAKYVFNSPPENTPQRYKFIAASKSTNNPYARYTVGPLPANKQVLFSSSPQSLEISRHVFV